MVRTASDFDSAFVAGAVDGDQAMLVLTAPVIDENRSRFVALAAGNRMLIFTKRDSSLKAADCYPMDKCGERIPRPPPMRFGKGTRVGVFSFLATNCRRGCFPQTPSCVGFFKDPSGDQHFGFFGEKIESTVIYA